MIKKYRAYALGKNEAMAAKVKIRTVSNCSIAATIVLSSLCIALSLFGIQKYTVFRNATQEYISCESAIKQLQAGSDNLTRQVRLAAMTGEQKYIDAYFEEANVTKNREKALDDLSELECDTAALDTLQAALDSSVHLMQTEYYAMRLVEEAGDIPQSLWPEEILATDLNDEDRQLSSEEMLNKARQLVVSIDYENAKTEISDEVDISLNMLMQEIANRENRAATIFSDAYKKLMFCIFLLALMTLLICLMMRYWIVKPLLSYNENISHGIISPVCGANELQMLAHTYNQVYEENEERELIIKHQAEHDPLTGLLNRGSYDRILDLYQKDQNNFALILIDVDIFKSVNDTYGHAVGDQILKKVAGLLTSAFRTIDYICRIGGDEFAIIMVDMTSDLRYTIEEKIEFVNDQLTHPEDGSPVVSLSVGVAFTDRENPGESLFKDADQTLYYTKEHGKCGCNFYPVG